MDNPHADQQAVLLERVLENSVSQPDLVIDTAHSHSLQSVCTETILELNQCVEVRRSINWRHFNN